MRKVKNTMNFTGFRGVQNCSELLADHQGLFISKNVHIIPILTHFLRDTPEQMESYTGYWEGYPSGLNQLGLPDLLT